MRVILAMAALAASASPCFAAITTYDAFTSFSATPGATGPFTYGSFDVVNGSFTEFAPGGMCNTPNVICQSASPVPEILPEVLKSTIGAFNYWTAYAPANALDVHPGSNPDESNSVAIMFTAPRAGVYTFAGSAKVADILASGTNLYAYSSASGGSVTRLGSLTLASPSFTADPTLTLARGDRVGLIVGNAGNYLYDTTSVNLSATVASVPEAGTWTMIIAGIAMVGVAKRRREAAVAA